MLDPSFSVLFKILLKSKNKIMKLVYYMKLFC